jgi:hypothetical protein
MLVCPSQAAADEMFDWLTKTEPKRIETLPLGFLDSGVDVDSVSLAGGLSAKAGAVSAKSSSDLEAKESAIARCRAGKRWYRFWLDPLDAKGATTRVSENFVFSGKWQWSRN